VSLQLVLWVAIACLANVAPGQSLQVIETDHAITVKHDHRVVVAYNKKSPAAPLGIDSIYQRSGCLHPLNSPKGRTVTDMFPYDHPHQHGVFSAWVKTTHAGRTVDFWNLAGGKGRVLHDRVLSTFKDRDGAGFEVELIHRALAISPVDVLRERWKVTVYPTDGTYHAFDLQTVQTALTDKSLTVHKHHYGGIALRGLTRWLTAEDGGAREHPELAREPSGFLNDLGSNRVEGNLQHAKWVALWGNIDGAPVSIAVLCHAENFRAPQATRLHPTKPYFCFAPCVDGDFAIDRDHAFESKYRFLVTDTEPDSEWIDQQWDKWCGR
jgi:hypothetical protein